MTPPDDKDRKKPSTKPARSGANIAARFVTPIAGDNPVNPEAESDQPFTTPPAVEQKARRPKAS